MGVPRCILLCLIVCIFTFEAFAREDNESALPVFANSFEAGNYIQAERDFREQLSSAESPAQELLALGNLGLLLTMQKRFQEAEPNLNRAVTIARVNRLVDVRILPVILGNLSLIYSETGRAALAADTIRESIRLGKKLLGERPEYLADLLMKSGILHFKSGDLKKAEDEFKDAVSMLEKQGKYNPQLTGVLSSMAALYFYQQKSNLAEAAYLRALDITERAKGREHPDLYGPLGGLSVVYAKRGDYAAAEGVLQRALSILRQAYDPMPPNGGTMAATLADVLIKLGRMEEAEELYAEALAIHERALGPRSSEVAVTLQHFAGLMYLVNRPAMAREMEARAESIRYERMHTVAAKDVR